MKKCNVNGLISCSEKYSYVIYGLFENLQSLPTRNPVLLYE